jgi:hypothetical protein
MMTGLSEATNFNPIVSFGLRGLELSLFMRIWFFDIRLGEKY